MSTEDRVSRFEQEIAALRLKTSGGSAERYAGALGVLMMAAGIGIAIGAAFKSGNKQDSRDLEELIILNIAMLGLVVAGAALFLWRVLSQFGRFWMLRQTFEHQRHVEQLVEASRPANRTPTSSNSEGRLMELVPENERAVGLGGSAPERQGA
jgi:hypothetical protein